MVVFLGKRVSFIYLCNNDIDDTFTHELWFCCMRFLRLLAFIRKLCSPSFYFAKN